MKRKRVVIVTGNQRVAQAIFNDVKAVFNDDVDIDIVYPSQIASLDAVEADAFLVTRWYNIGGLTDKVSSKSKVVRTTRTISESGYKKITQIPPGTNVLVVNDSEQSTSGVIELRKYAVPVGYLEVFYVVRAVFELFLNHFDSIRVCAVFMKGFLWTTRH